MTTDPAAVQHATDVDVLRELLAALPADHPDRSGVRHAIRVLCGDEQDDDNVLVLRRPPGIADEEWRDLIGFARVTVTLKAGEARERHG